MNKNARKILIKLLLNRKITKRIHDDVSFFCCLLLGFKPTYYQKALLEDVESKNICVLFCRQSGKSFTLGARALWRAITNRNWQLLVVSASMRQSLILRRKIQQHFNNIPTAVQTILFEEILKTTITTRSGSLIAFEPAAAFDRIRGYSANEILADEMAMFREADELYDQILDPMMDATDGTFVGSSTPKTKSGKFWQLCNDNEFKVLHANWFDAVQGGVLSKSRMQKLLRRYKAGKISKAIWMMEREARFFDDMDKLIPYQSILDCVDTSGVIKTLREPFIGQPGQYYVGVDLGKIKDPTVIVIVDKVAPTASVDALHLRFMKVFNLQTPYEKVQEYLTMIGNTLRPKRMYVDSTANTYFMEELKKRVKVSEGINFTEPRKKEMGSILHHKIKHKNLILPENREKLYFGLNVVEYKTTEGGKKVLQTTRNEHDDIFWASALAVYAASKYKGGIAK